jgi:hypothetical protein
MNLAATHYRRCPLRPSLHTFVFISLVILSNKVVGAPPEVQRDNYASPPQEWEFYGSTPDEHVKNWIKIVILTARERPLPIVFFSTQQFELKGRPEQLIVIGDAEYSRLAAITRSQTCLHSAPKPKDMEWGISKVTTHDRQSTRGCVLHQPAACDYLVAIATMPDIHLNTAQLNPIRDLSVAMGCKNPLPDVNAPIVTDH